MQNNAQGGKVEDLSFTECNDCSAVMKESAKYGHFKATGHERFTPYHGVRIYAVRELVDTVERAAKRHGWDEVNKAGTLISMLETHKDFLGPYKLKGAKWVSIDYGNRYRGMEDPFNVREGDGCDACGTVGPSWVQAGDPGAGLCDKCLFKLFAVDDHGRITAFLHAEAKCAFCDYTNESQEAVEDHEDREHPHAKLTPERRDALVEDIDEAKRWPNLSTGGPDGATA